MRKGGMAYFESVNHTLESIKIPNKPWKYTFGGKYDFQECDNSFYRVHRKYHWKFAIPFISHYKHKKIENKTCLK